MECHYIPELSYSELRERMRQGLSGERIPVSGSLELTLRCNLRCKHCYIAHGHNGIPGKQELSLGEIRRILDEITDAGCFWLLLTGGEIMVRPDFLDIYQYAKLKGMLVTLFTNGTMITPRIADFLAEWAPFNTEISLYGATQETYERVTGIPGSYARCMRGIELLMERNIPLKLKTVAMTLNQHEVYDMKAFSESLGLSFRFDAMLNAGADGSGKPLPLRISAKEVVELDLMDPKRVAGWREFRQKHQGMKRDQRYLYACGAGLYSFHIDPYGELSLCMMVRHETYDLRKGSFRQGWDEYLHQVRSQPGSENSPCSSCDLHALCGSCPGWAQMEHGDASKHVGFQCQVTHLRAKAFDFELPVLNSYVS